MKWRNLTLALTGVIVGVIALVCFTPLAPGDGGRSCGPEGGQLYRFVQDELVL